VGKPANMESKINEVFSDFISDIKSNNKNTQDRFINYLDTKNINNKILRQVERNYTNFVSNKKGSYQNAVTKIIQELSISQQNYIQYLSRANTILHIETSDNGTDGLQTKNGEVKIINISGTTAVNSSSNGASNTFQELQNDIKTIQTSLFNFYKDIISSETISYKNSTYNSNFIFGDSANSTNYIKIKKQVFYPFSTEKEFDYLSFRRSYMILSDEILDDKKYQTFKTAIIGNIINNSSLNTSGNIDLSKEFDTYWLLVAKPLFQKETEITNLFLDKVEKNTLKNFVKFTPFGTKDRLFSYSVSQTPSNEQKVLIKSLGAIDNSNKNVKTWNTYDYVDTYISKVKLN
jgi:hypothetical protein